METTGPDDSGVPDTRVIVDAEVCVGAGQCVLAAPEIFDQGDEDGLVRLLSPTPPGSLLAAVRDAERRCPSGAVIVRGDADD